MMHSSRVSDHRISVYTVELQWVEENNQTIVIITSDSLSSLSSIKSEGRILCMKSFMCYSGYIIGDWIGLTQEDVFLQHSNVGE